jgi:hypothetical protein
MQTPPSTGLTDAQIDPLGEFLDSSEDSMILAIAAQAKNISTAMERGDVALRGCESDACIGTFQRL